MQSVLVCNVTSVHATMLFRLGILDILKLTMWKHYNFNFKTSQIPGHLEFKVRLYKTYSAFTNTSFRMILK